MKKLFLTLVVFSSTLLPGVLLLAQEPQSEFVPVTEIPASEQLPSAPLVIAAYAFVWLAFAAYVWTMWRKLGKVEHEIGALSAQINKPRAARSDGVRP
jgi:CcmD family protein